EGEVACRVDRVIVRLPPMQIIEAGLVLVPAVNQREGLVDLPVVVGFEQITVPVAQTHLARDREVGEAGNPPAVGAREFPLRRGAGGGGGGGPDPLTSP